MRKSLYDTVIWYVQSTIDSRVFFKVYKYKDHCILPSGYTLLIDKTEGSLLRIDPDVLDNLSPLEVKQKLGLTEDQKVAIMTQGSQIMNRGVYSIDNVNIIKTEKGN
jgi:hypothetical protein